MGADIHDNETQEDRKNLELYATRLRELGYSCEILIGYGPAKQEIPKLVRACRVTLLVMGAHGHRTFKDMIFGATIDTVRHAVDIPVLIVR